MNTNTREKLDKLNKLTEGFIESSWDGEWGYILIDHNEERKELIRSLGVDEQTIQDCVCETPEGLNIDILPIAVFVNETTGKDLAFSHDKKEFYIR